jgi:DNA-binding GntR family transcriptional regulator
MTGREVRVVAGLVELDRTSLRERAMHRLRNAVAAGEIAPGTRLVETELSATLSISRGTLREALRQLEYEGLVESGTRGRWTVCTLTDAELADMFAVRSALEGLAAATLSSRPDRPLLIRRLHTALAEFQGAEASISELVEADLAFHELLCELTGNVSLMRAWQTVTGPTRVAILFAGPAAAPANMSAVRHQLLVDAIATGDPQTARSAVDNHMRGHPHPARPEPGFQHPGGSSVGETAVDAAEPNPAAVSRPTPVGRHPIEPLDRSNLC